MDVANVKTSISFVAGENRDSPQLGIPAMYDDDDDDDGPEALVRMVPNVIHSATRSMWDRS